jgi:hypothetical protein
MDGLLDPDDSSDLIRVHAHLLLDVLPVDAETSIAQESFRSLRSSTSSFGGGHPGSWSRITGPVLSLGHRCFLGGWAGGWQPEAAVGLLA